MKNKETHEYNSDEKRPKHSRIRNILFSVINPASDLKIIYQSGIKPTIDKIKKFAELPEIKSTKKETLNFEQAVQISGSTVEQLKIKYRKRQMFWWFPMIIAMALSLMIIAMTFLASHLPEITLLRAIAWAMILASFSFYCFTSCLKAAYRYWQLVNKKVSIEEGGTFSEFMKEKNQILETFILRVPLRKGKK